MPVMSVVQSITEVAAMINDETRRKLREMNLGEVVTALELQQQDLNCVTLPFDERFQRITDYSKIQRLIKLSKFSCQSRGNIFITASAALTECHTGTVHAAVHRSNTMLFFKLHRIWEKPSLPVIRRRLQAADPHRYIRLPDLW